MGFSVTFGLPALRGHRALVVALAVDAIGSGCSGPLMLLFLTRVAGLELGPAGVLLTAAGLVSLVVPAVVGSAIPRFGTRNVVIGAQLIQAVAMAGFLVARGWPFLAGCALLAAVGNRIFWSSIFGLVAAAADTGPAGDHDKWFALSGMVQGGGFAVGALLAGALLAFPGTTPYLVALSVNGASFLLSGVLLWPEHSQRRGLGSTAGAAVLHDRPYLALILVNTLFATCSVLLSIGLPVYVVDGLHAPGWVVGPLLALDLVLGATCQGLAVRKLSGHRRTRLMVAAGALWVCWGALMALLSVLTPALVVPTLLIAVVVFAVAELIHAPFSMALAARAAPPNLRASYLSYFQYSFGLAVVIAPAGFALLFEVNGALPWLGIGVVALLAALGMLALEPRLPSSANAPTE